jgi:nuclease S1
MRRLARGTAIFVLTVLLRVASAWPWGADGHQIVARIAAKNLSATARRNVARLLRVSSNPSAVANAMAAAAIWPDTVLRDLDPDTKPWRFLDICLGDDKDSVGQRCLRRGCVTQKIEEYQSRLQRRKYDKWGGKGDLGLLIHFIGDIHQPLHCASNADRGGNCVHIDSRSATDLHGFWDNDVVMEIEDQFGTGVEGVADQLAQDLQRNPFADSFSWKTGRAKDIAWESHQLAQSHIYRRLSVPKQSCLTRLEGCDAAPLEVKEMRIRINSTYMSEAAAVARTQLMRAGIRLAELLNAIWP